MKTTIRLIEDNEPRPNPALRSTPINPDPFVVEVARRLPPGLRLERQGA